MVSATVVLTGCGGGGRAGSVDVAVPPVVLAPLPALAAYVDTWQPACENQYRQLPIATAPCSSARHRDMIQIKSAIDSARIAAD